MDRTEYYDSLVKNLVVVGMAAVFVGSNLIALFWI